MNYIATGHVMEKCPDWRMYTNVNSNQISVLIGEYISTSIATM